MHNSEPLDCNEVETSTKPNNCSKNGISQPSSSHQCGPDFCNKEKLQLEALLERLTLEESSLAQDIPVNYCHVYSELVEEIDPNQHEIRKNCRGNEGMGCVRSGGVMFDIVSQDCAGQFTKDRFKWRDTSKPREMCQNNLCIETQWKQLTNSSFNTEGFEKPLFIDNSTATSLSDLMALDDSRSVDVNNLVVTTVLASDNRVVDVPICPYESKTGNHEVNAVVLETPLIFSRCSSLDSVNSCEQLSNFESSVVSETSCMTSGLVSPSELPDSPTNFITQCPCIPVSINLSKEQNTELKKTSTIKPITKSINDLICKDKVSKEIDTNLLPTASAPENDLEEEYLLANCITFGMQCSYVKTTVGGNSNSSVLDNKLISKISDKSVIPIKSIAIDKISQLEVTDFTTVYNTEDSPSIISHSTSHTNLSNLCSTCGNSDINILDDCIRSGMPNAHPTYH
ncbi:anaphase-promoting complex subunit 2 [Homalodisca vitripennis]|nr:anaphase-promoting complex subunit 2 [Homalodisca vitripennis]